MPIRFRCNCGQLLGIARRKAGSTVRCPSCQKDVLVPAQAEASASAPPPPEPGGPALFERDDFDDLLQGGMSMGGVPARGSAVQAPPPPARPQPMPPAVPVVQMEAQPWPAPAAPAARPAPPPGIYLTPGRATVLVVVAILLLALAFASGLIVGLFVL